jgi:hypothetical protein
MPIIYTNPYKQSYLAAKQELEERLVQVKALQDRIEWLRATITATEPLANADQLPPKIGPIADLCCTVLGANPGRSMSVQDVIRVIAAMGIKLDYANVPGVIHTNLMRLVNKPNSPVILDAPGVTFEGSRPVQNGPMKFYWNPTVPAPEPSMPYPDMLG